MFGINTNCYRKQINKVKETCRKKNNNLIISDPTRQKKNLNTEVNKQTKKNMKDSNIYTSN